MCPKLVRDRLAHQPQTILGEPAIGGFRLVQLQLFLEQVAQPVEQLALQCVLGCGQRLVRVAAEFLGDGGLVGLHDQLAKRAGVLVLAGQDVQQGSPQIGEAVEPVENLAVQQPGVQQSGGCTVQPILAVLAVAEAIRPLQRAMPGMPESAIGIFDMQIDSDLADVVQ